MLWIVALQDFNKPTKRCMIMKILGIRLPLSSDPLYVQIEDVNEPLNTVLTKTVAGLEEAGDHSTSSQLSRLLSDHFPFTLKGARLDNSMPVGTLSFEPKILEGQTIEFSEITLLKRHLGGH
jgi:hypothetical protein